MMPDNEALLNQTLLRIEGKLDSAIANHGERIASLETSVEVVTAKIDKAETWTNVKHVAVGLAAILGKTGLDKLLKF